MAAAALGFRGATDRRPAWAAIATLGLQPLRLLRQLGELLAVSDLRSMGGAGDPRQGVRGG